LEKAGKVEHPLSSKTGGKNTLFESVIWLRVAMMCLKKKTSLKIHKAQGSQQEVFQLIPHFPLWVF
jgi:hypothetical protein